MNDLVLMKMGALFPPCTCQLVRVTMIPMIHQPNTCPSYHVALTKSHHWASNDKSTASIPPAFLFVCCLFTAWAMTSNFRLTCSHTLKLNMTLGKKY